MKLGTGSLKLVKFLDRGVNPKSPMKKLFVAMVAID
jgi:hypothetical protein